MNKSVLKKNIAPTKPRQLGRKVGGILFKLAIAAAGIYGIRQAIYYYLLNGQ